MVTKKSISPIKISLPKNFIFFTHHYIINKEVVFKICKEEFSFKISKLYISVCVIAKDTSPKVMLEKML